MKKRGERNCIVCGKKYEYCPHCGKGKPEEGWRNLYDSEKCKDIFSICSNYAFKHISAAEAKKKLDKYNVGDGSGYSDDIKQNIKDINAEVSAKKAVQPQETPVKKHEGGKEQKDS